MRAAQGVGDAADEPVDLLGREGPVGGPELDGVADVLPTGGQRRSVEEVEEDGSFRQPLRGRDDGVRDGLDGNPGVGGVSGERRKSDE